MSQAEKPIIQQNQEAFDLTLDTLPRVQIRADGIKLERTPDDLPEIKFSNITTRTKLSKLKDYVAIDTETTGLSAKKNKIIEVCAIRFADWEPVEIFETLVNPERKLSANAMRVNHITSDMIKDAPKLWQIMPELTTFIGGLPIVGHNLSFDLDFLYMAGMEFGKKQRFYDTLSLSRKTVRTVKQVWDKELMDYCPPDNYDPFTQVLDHKLATMCRFYLICDHCDHRAAGDALAAGYLFECLAKERTTPDPT